MLNQKNNGGGNPNHAADGKFTSGANQTNASNYEDKIKKVLGIEQTTQNPVEKMANNEMGPGKVKYYDSFSVLFDLYPEAFNGSVDNDTYSQMIQVVMDKFGINNDDATEHVLEYIDRNTISLSERRKK